jgi:hypothetical protein
VVASVPESKVGSVSRASIYPLGHIGTLFQRARKVPTGLAPTAGSALALQTRVTQVDKNGNGTTTYHFAIQLDSGEALTPGESKTDADFVAVYNFYNFYGLVDGAVRSPAGWAFSSENSGRTPMLNGYPLVLAVDVPNTPNLTWTVTKPVAAGARIEGFAATTRVSTIVQDEYTAQATHQSPAVPGVGAGTAAAAAMATKQAVIGLSRRPASSPTSSSNLAARAGHRGNDGVLHDGNHDGPIGAHTVCRAGWVVMAKKTGHSSYAQAGRR